MAKPPGAVPGKGCWDALVRGGARWVSKDAVEDSKEASEVVVETFDVRTVGTARVARLRWLALSGGKQDPYRTDDFDQVALTNQGIYFLSADLDDAGVQGALRGKPTYADPPRTVPSGRGDYVEGLASARGPIVCFGSGPSPKDPRCEDVCNSEMCVSPTDGVVTFEGSWAPGMSMFAQPGYRADDAKAAAPSPTGSCNASADCRGASPSLGPGKRCYGARQSPPTHMFP